MPSIETLIEDIQRLVEDDSHVVSDEAKERLGKDIAATIVSNLFNDRAKQAAKGALRMSSLGTSCDRELWLKDRHPEAREALPYNARLKYLFGHILEELLLFLAEESGHKVEKRQQILNLNGVAGQRDCVIDGVQIDVKSASTRGFEKFKKHELETNDPFGYIVQNNAYWYADKELTDERVGFLAIDKQFGHVCLDLYPVDKSRDYSELVDQKRSVLASDAAPRRGYIPEPDGKSGNLKLCTKCSYCDVKGKCWPDLRAFLYSSGPRYLTHVAKLPDVREVTSVGDDEESS